MLHFTQTVKRSRHGASRWGSAPKTHYSCAALLLQGSKSICPPSTPVSPVLLCEVVYTTCMHLQYSITRKKGMTKQALDSLSHKGPGDRPPSTACFLDSSIPSVHSPCFALVQSCQGSNLHKGTPSLDSDGQASTDLSCKAYLCGWQHKGYPTGKQGQRHQPGARTLDGYGGTVATQTPQGLLH